jgi:hypothetical protein
MELRDANHFYLRFIRDDSPAPKRPVIDKPMSAIQKKSTCSLRGGMDLVDNSSGRLLVVMRESGESYTD